MPPAFTPAADKAKTDTLISFNRDIRPILSDKCFACHGPDAAIAINSGGFRLDDFNEANKYEGHWAYQTPTKPAVPELDEAGEAWAKNNIDRFIAYGLAYKGLTPSKETDKTKLICRVSLDLTSLPPTYGDGAYRQ